MRSSPLRAESHSTQSSHQLSVDSNGQLSGANIQAPGAVTFTVPTYGIVARVIWAGCGPLAKAS